MPAGHRKILLGEPVSFVPRASRTSEPGCRAPAYPYPFRLLRNHQKQFIISLHRPHHTSGGVEKKKKWRVQCEPATYMCVVRVVWFLCAHRYEKHGPACESVPATKRWGPAVPVVKPVSEGDRRRRTCCRRLGTLYVHPRYPMQ